MGFDSAMKRWIIVGLALVAGACGRQGFRTKDYVTPETLMEASKREFRKGHYGAAKTGFQRVTFEVPTTDPLGGEARYYLAECEYAQGEFLDAYLKVRRHFHKLMELYLFEMPVALRSEMDDIYKTVYELKKKVRTLERQMNNMAAKEVEV